MTYDPALVEADRHALRQMAAPVSAQTSTQSTENLSPDEWQRALRHAWQALQETPSYVDQRLAANCGLIESIASQR